MPVPRLFHWKLWKRRKHSGVSPTLGSSVRRSHSMMLLSSWSFHLKFGSSKPGQSSDQDVIIRERENLTHLVLGGRDRELVAACQESALEAGSRLDGQELCSSW